MAATDSTRILLLKHIISKRRKRRRLLMKGMAIILQQRLLSLKSLLLAAMFSVVNNEPSRTRIRSCRTLPRNTGWWEKVWFIYDNKRFKQTLRISRSTFDLILARIRPHLEKVWKSFGSFPVVGQLLMDAILPLSAHLGAKVLEKNITISRTFIPLS